MPSTDNSSKNALPTGDKPSRWLATIPYVFLVGLALLAITLFTDYLRRGTLETTLETTAAGDTAYFQIEKRPIDRVTQILTFRDQPLYFARLKTKGIRDTQMRVIGKESSNRYFIYRPENPELRVGPHGQDLVFVKFAPNKYFRLQTMPGAPGMHEVPENEWLPSNSITP